MCADCGWTKVKNEESRSSAGIKPDYVQQTPRSFLGHNDEMYAVDRTKAIIDQDESYSRIDEDSLPSRATIDSSSLVRSKTAYHTDAYENTAIEVEYYDAGVPDDEIDDDVPPYDGFLQLDNSGDVAAFVRPQDKAMSDINVASNSDNVAYAISKSKSWSAPDRNSYLEAMAKKAKEDFIKRKNAGLDPALREFKDVDNTVDTSRENGRRVPSSITENSHQGYNGQINPMGDISSHNNDERKINYKSPCSVVEFPCIEASSFVNDDSIEIASDVGPRNSIPLGLKKVQSEIPRSSSKSAFLRIRKSTFKKVGLDSPRRISSISDGMRDDPYNIESKGSILSLGRKKKVKDGKFYEIDDGSQSDENKSTETGSPPFFDNKSKQIESRPGDDIFDFEDSSHSPVMPKSAPISTVRLDPREDSCDVSILGSLAGNGDGGTVLSSRSMYTTGTNATNWSTSTRRRHRGAAKHRLSEAKDDNERPTGWLESIKAAAEKNNYRWDPKRGWIDYVEPKDEASDESKVATQRIGRLKPPKFKGTERSMRNDDESSCADSRSSSTILPFPSKWQKDREEMLRTDDGAASAVTEVASNKILKQNKKQLHSLSKDVSVQLELGVTETIVEDSDENFDSDNKSDSRNDSQNNSRDIANMTGSSNSSEEIESDNIPEKGKLFEWVGKIDQEHNLRGKVEDTSKETKLLAEKYNEVGKVVTSNVLPDIPENNKNSSQESDADEFGQNSGSFDFSVTDSAKDMNEEVVENLEDDGFKVIKDSKGMGFEHKKKKSSQIGHGLRQVSEQMSSLMEKYNPKDTASITDASRAVTNSNSVSSKAKDWLEKMEKSNSRDLKGSNSVGASKSTLFGSAVNDSTKFEYNTSEVVSEENDTLFDFNESSNEKAYTRKVEEEPAPYFMKPPNKIPTLNESISGLTSASGVSELGQNNTSRYGSFLSRLQACTSPAFEDDAPIKSMPRAHLAFMRNSAENQDNRLINMIKNQAFCGSTDNTDESVKNVGLPPRKPTNLSASAKGRSNVASNYLQAIKEKSQNQSGMENVAPDNLKRVNTISSTSSSNSESWQTFLEKRNKALASSTSRNSDVSSSSKAAEEYARTKVQEVIKRISKDKAGEQLDDSRRAQSAARTRPPSNTSSIPRSLSTGRVRAPSNSLLPSANRDNVAKAAEDLAAAKVEAMMSMMSNTSLEGEI
jgi:hypothetical protein